jgi:hypothetical protein
VIRALDEETFACLVLDSEVCSWTNVPASDDPFREDWRGEIRW